MTARRIMIAIAILLLIVWCVYAIKEGLSIFSSASVLLLTILFEFGRREFRSKVIAQSMLFRRPILETEPFRKEYISSFEQISLFIFSIILIVLGVGMISGLVSIAIVLFILATVFMLFSVKPLKLVLSDEGIEFIWVFHESKYRWTDIQEIVRYRDGTDYLIMADKNQKIPLSIFDGNWRKRDIGRIIRKQAPFLEFLD